MLEFKNICFSRDNKEILKGVNLKIDDEKMVVITGQTVQENQLWQKLLWELNNQIQEK